MDMLAHIAHKIEAGIDRLVGRYQEGRRLVSLAVWLACFVAMVGVGISTVAASSYEINSIEVAGNQRVESETVRAYLQLPTSGSISESDINAGLKRLYKTSLFANVKMEVDKGVLRVRVEENPIINQITFEGNKRVSADDLRKELTIQERSVYTRSRVQEEVQKVLARYQKEGRFSVKVDPEIIQLDQNRVNLVFKVDEGKKASIESIAFIGNDEYSDRELANEIKSKEARWYRFFTGDDIYDPDRMLYDKELLRRFYMTHGYADFSVKSAIADITKSEDAFHLTYTIDEGLQYHFGKIQVLSEIPQIDPALIKDKALTIEGEVFNGEQIEKSIEKMVDFVTDYGYAFVDIDPVFHRDPVAQTISIDYTIKEGPKVYIERIDIVGNVRTQDRVIRREFTIAEGDAYNAAKIRASKKYIENLNFFKKVELNTKKGSQPDRAIIEVQVEEQSTGELNFGAGFSTTEGGLVNVSISERNLLGRGQTLRLAVQKAQRGLETNISFVEPYFLGRDLSLGFDLFRIVRDLTTDSSFDSETYGGVVRLGYSITDDLRHSLSYTYRTDKITNISVYASRFIKDQEGENVTSMVGHVLQYDKRDNNQEPTKGYNIRFSQDLAGLGGDSQYLRNELRAEYYYPVYKDDVILRVAGKSGYIFGLGGKEVRINERFFIGGNDFRGFRNAGIGPRDIDTKDSLGGNMYYVGTTEVTYPLGLPEELGLRGAAFVDAGSLFHVEDEGPEVVDENSIRMSYGLGISWKSPLGPIRLDYGIPLVKEDYDRIQEFRVSFGTKF